MVVRETGSYVCADVAHDVSAESSYPKTFGATMTFSPDVVRESSYSGQTGLEFAIASRAAGYVVITKSGDKYSKPFVSAHCEVHRFNDSIVVLYDLAYMISKLYIHDSNAMEMSDWREYGPTKTFMNDFAIATGVLPKTYVCIDHDTYLFYDNTDRANASGLFKANRIAWKNRDLIYVEGIDMTSYRTRMVPTTPEGYRSYFVYNGEIGADISDVVLKPSSDTKTQARAALAKIARGVAFNAQEMENLRQTMVDYQDGKLVRDDTTLNFSYPLVFRCPTDQATIIAVLFEWANDAGLVKFINSGSFETASYFRANTTDLEQLEEELNRRKESIENETREAINAYYASWFTVVDSNRKLYNSVLRGTEFPVDLSETIESFGERSLISKLSFNSVAVSFKDLNDFVQRIQRGEVSFNIESNTYSTTNDDQLASLKALRGPVDMVSYPEADYLEPSLDKAQFTESDAKDIIADQFAVPVQQSVRRYIADDLEILNGLSDRRFRMGVDLIYSMQVGDENKQFRYATINKKKMQWFFKYYWSLQSKQPLLWPKNIPSILHNGYYDRDAEDDAVNLAELGYGLDNDEAFARAAGVDNWKVLPYDPGAKDQQPISQITIKNVKKDQSGNVRGSITSKFSVWVNMIPFIHAYAGESTSVARTKEYVQAYFNGKNGVSSVKFRCLSSGTMPGVETLGHGVDYGTDPSKGVWEFRDDWFMNFDKNKNQSGSGVGINNNAPADLSIFAQNGEKPGWWLTLTRYCKFDIEFTHDDVILASKNDYDKPGCYVRGDNEHLEYSAQVFDSRAFDARNIHKILGEGANKLVQAYTDYYLGVIEVAGKMQPVIYCRTDTGIYLPIQVSEFLSKSVSGQKAEELSMFTDKMTGVLQAIRSAAMDPESIEGRAYKKLSSDSVTTLNELIQKYQEEISIASKVPSARFIREEQIRAIDSGVVNLALIGAYAVL